MSEFERRILACVGPLNTPTKEQVKNLCHSISALPKLQETLLTRLDRPRELNVSTLEIEHILVVIRQCCFITPLSFVDFFRDRLYLIASFCNYEDPRNESGAVKVRTAALALSGLLKDYTKLNEERRKCSPSSLSPQSPSIWLPSPAAMSSLELTPRAKETPLLSPTPRRSFLPTPDASPVQGTSRLVDEVIPSRRSPTAEAVSSYDIEMTIRGLLKRSSREILNSKNALKEIAQATTDENKSPIIISLLLEYIFLDENESITKVLNIMNYCVKYGSLKFISMLQDHRQSLLPLSDRPYPSQINILAKTVLETIEARTGQPMVKSPPQHVHSPDRRNSILTFTTDGMTNDTLTSSLLLDRDIRDLTAFVTSTSSEPLSRGGYALVYVARIDMGDRSERVAKKIIYRNSNPNTELKRLVREINAWTGLTHPNVGRLYGITREQGDRIGLISPFYEKGDIIKHIRNTRGTLNTKGFLTLMKEITAGVIYLHQEGIIHGDIKGANIMVDDTNHPRLIDFGVSRIVGVQGLTTSGYGTSWAWAAPELLEEPKKTQQSDIYALASTFVEMMTLRPPLIERKNCHLVLAVHNGEIPIRPQRNSSAAFYPGDKLWVQMMCCWEKADSRPSAIGVGKFLDELEDITDDY